jgi:hypothetical protein
MKFVLTTPVLTNYTPRLAAEAIMVPAVNNFPENQPLYFHFFNSDCPCSSFNLKHFLSLKKQFENQIKIYAITLAYADLEYAKEMIDDESISIIQDKDDPLATACSV